MLIVPIRRISPTRLSKTLGPLNAPTRARTLGALFAGAALMNAAMAAASATATIVAANLLGAMWGAVPNTAGIAGTGIGALIATRVMNRRGPRAGLLIGYAAAAAGGIIAVVCVGGKNIAGLTGGMLLLGLGNAAAQLSRYVAADLYPAGRRGFAIAAVIWAGTVGAVGGPLLLKPSSDLSAGLGLAPLTGPFLLASLATTAAMAAAGRGAPRKARAVGPHVPLRALARSRSARSALAAMATAQVVMVAVMTAAPLDMHMHGQGLTSVGMALSAHTFGMFALSPLTGWLIDRRGSRPVILGGLAMLAVAAALAAMGSGDLPHRTAALFLLGYGWNLCFVGGSSRLARGLAAADRARVEGAVDAAVWGVAAAASMGSTMIMSAGTYAVLAGAAGALVVLPASVLLSRANDRAEPEPPVRVPPGLGPHDLEPHDLEPHDLGPHDPAKEHEGVS
jgi:MFS family permease